MEETSHLRDEETEPKEMISLSKVIPLVVAEPAFEARTQKLLVEASWFQNSILPLLAAPIELLYVEEWADWRIHGFEGCLVWIRLFKAVGKISKKPRKQNCLSLSSLVIVMKNKLSGVGSGTSWLSLSTVESHSKELSPEQKQRSVFLINPG